MKFILTTATILALLTLAAFLSSCSLLGIDTEQASAEAEAYAAQLQPVADKLTALDAKSRQLIEQAEIARTKGNLQAYAELTRQVAEVAREIDLGKKDYERVAVAYQQAVKRFEDAKGAGDYLTGILGLLAGVLGMFGIGVPAIKRRDRALALTAANIETGLSEEELGNLKTLQSRAFANDPGALKVLNKARGK